MFNETMLIIIWAIFGNRLIIYGPEYDQPGTINLFDLMKDQPGIHLPLLWQSMINLFCRETRVNLKGGTRRTEKFYSNPQSN